MYSCRANCSTQLIYWYLTCLGPDNIVAWPGLAWLGLRWIGQRLAWLGWGLARTVLA